MGQALSIALQINQSRTPRGSHSLNEQEEHVYQEMLSFHGLNGLSLAGRRALFKDLKLIAKAELMRDGTVVLFRAGSGRVECRDLADFDQCLGEAMAEYLR